MHFTGQVVNGEEKKERREKKKRQRDKVNSEL